jgi:hypothetical protein
MDSHRFGLIQGGGNTPDKLTFVHIDEDMNVTLTHQDWIAGGSAP